MSSKKCQVCGSENASSEFFCRNCGSEILIASTSATPAAPAASLCSANASVQAPEVCPKCGQTNQPVLPLCTKCGFDLAAVAQPASANSRLCLIIGAESFECKDGDVLGREGTVARSYFSAIGTVSRQHVTIKRREGCWLLTASAAVQNITQLDGREIPRGVEQPLSGEHVLKLSTQCEVRLRVVSNANAADD